MPRTLTSNALSWYLKQGARPRVFLSIPGAGKYWSTDESGDFVEKIESIGRITNKIDAFGGMSSVSDCEVTIAKAGDDNKETFFTSVSIAPHDEGVIKGAGRLMKTGSAGESYFYVRSGTTGSLASEALVVGQRYNPGTNQYSNYRAYIQCKIPSDLTSCEEAYIPLTGINDESDVDFDLHVYEGNWSSLGNGMYNEFDGWIAGSTDYTGIRLNDLLNTSNFVVGENYIRFNRAGRDAIVAAAGGTLKLMVLSSRDVTYTTPTGNEYVRFERSDALETPTLELQYNTMPLDNERATIYLAFKETSGALPTSTDGMQAIWSGVVDSYDLEPTRLKLKLRHDDFKRNRTLDTNIITTDEIDFENTPDTNIGKCKPIVIGDFARTMEHRNGIGYFKDSAGVVQFGYGEFFKCIVYDNTEENTIKALAADHELKETGNFAAFYESAADRFVLIAGDISTSGNGLVQIDKNTSVVFPYRITSNDNALSSIKPISTYIPLLKNNFGVTDPNNAVDTNTTNWSEVTDDGQSAEYSTGAIPYHVSGELSWTLCIAFETEAPNGYTTDAFQLVVHTLREKDGTLIEETWYDPISSNGQHYFVLWDVGGSPSTSYLRDSSVSVIVTMSTNVSGAPDFGTEKPCKYRNLCILRAYSQRPTSEFYIQGKGMPDNDDGDYTGVANDLIEKPCDVIQWLARAKGGLSASDIDTSFVDARTDFTNWKFTFQLNEYTENSNLFNYNGKDGIISDLGKQINASILWDEDGKLKIIPFDATDTFPVSGTDIPAGLDIVEYDGSPSGGSMTRNPVVEGSFKPLVQTPVKDVKNDFVVKYHKNAATGEYTKALYMTNGEGNYVNAETNMNETYLENDQTLAELKKKCADSYNEIHTTNTLEFEAWGINDDETANKLLQALIEWYSVRRWIAEFTTLRNAMNWALGDFKNIRFPDVYTQLGDERAERMKWKLIEIDPDLMRWQWFIKAIEV